MDKPPQRTYSSSSEKVGHNLRRKIPSTAQMEPLADPLLSPTVAKETHEDAITPVLPAGRPSQSLRPQSEPHGIQDLIEVSFLSNDQASGQTASGAQRPVAEGVVASLLQSVTASFPVVTSGSVGSTVACDKAPLRRERDTPPLPPSRRAATRGKLRTATQSGRRSEKNRRYC